MSHDDRVYISHVKDLIVDSLATYRLTRLVTEDVIAAPVRDKIFEKHPPHDRSWSYVLTCPWCSSVWIGIGVMIARKIVPSAWDPLAKGLAASAVTGVISERV